MNSIWTSLLWLWRGSGLKASSASIYSQWPTQMCILPINLKWRKIYWKYITLTSLLTRLAEQLTHCTESIINLPTSQNIHYSLSFTQSFSHSTAEKPFFCLELEPCMPVWDSKAVNKSGPANHHPLLQTLADRLELLSWTVQRMFLTVWLLFISCSDLRHHTSGTGRLCVFSVSEGIMRGDRCEEELQLWWCKKKIKKSEKKWTTHLTLKKDNRRRKKRM